MPPRLFNNRLFDHEKVRMSRNEAKNREKNQWGLLCKCPLSGQATAGISGQINANSAFTRRFLVRYSPFSLKKASRSAVSRPADPPTSPPQ
ncbi:MAG TPA: hypothetical protein DEO73_11780 [Pantoea sp.]|nr:hypothetical protein [Pantoea sp.]